MSSRPQRRRGRLTEQQEAAAKKLRDLREGGGASSLEQMEEEASVYEEVDEREYEKRQAGDRQMAHDFIEDDEGIGYLNEEEEEEPDVVDGKRSRADGKKGSKKQRLADRAGGPQSMNLSSYLRRGAKSTAAKKSQSAAAVVDEQQLMSSLLGDIQYGSKKQKSRQGPGAGQRPVKSAFASTAYKPSSVRAPEDFAGEVFDVMNEMDTELPSDAPTAASSGGSGAAQAAARSSIGSPSALNPKSPPTSPTHSPPQTRTGPTMLQYDQNTATNEWFSAPAPQAAAAQGPRSAVGSSSNVLQDDGELIMYWFDLHEEKYADPGTLYLFGKVQAPCQDGMEDEEPEFVSCCVKISKVDRNMYVVPRKMLQDPAGNDTDEPAEIVNLDNPNCVYHEFKRKMDAHRIPVAGCVKGVPVKRFCTFDNADVPRGMHDCLKFKCPAGVSSLPKDTWSGQSYSHIVGAETSCVEQLLIRRKIMGPCWLRIGNATPCNSPFSWCKVEFQTNGMKGISVAEEHRNTPPPKLRVMSLSLKTVFNESKRQNEVIMASTTVVNNVSAEAATPEWERNSDTRVILRAPEHRALPLDLRETIRSKSMPIEVQPSERVLLNCLFARIHRADPDIVVAHNIMAFDLEVLLNRGAKNKCANWDRIGRLRRRNQAPKLKGGGAQGAALAKYAAGRLLCDTYLSARDLVRQTTYTLTSLCQIQLGVSRDAVESEDVPKHFSDTKNLLGLAHHTAKDTRLVLALMTHLQIVPLTKQLTNLAGNLWARTLRGGKAERNEFLLLHEFYRARHSGTDAKFLLPDKKGYSNKPGEPKGRRTRKKAAYAGGLVLEPKKGFYDNMILLLDFNSLYPSIIREYNICFTTVPEQQQTEEGEEDVLPDLPSDSPKGILPRVIKTLIDSRSAVKRELKQATEGTAKYQQLDIRQMALKLTANSMYGCLGFTFSRFYAKPLAMLITAQGRSLLQRSKEITETSLGLEVVYGDTDSIMVNTRSNNYEEAIAKGREVLKKINEGYKCVELDIDGVFSNMLLLKKKKYAAMMIQGRGSDGQMMFSRKTSGLDMVRRDWCPISKEVSGYVLDRLLGGRSREDAVENIHTYLREIGENIQTQSWEGFVITKSITKMPHEYTDAKSQPHVQVAIKMIQANEQVQAGQEIQYLVLEGNSSSVTDRCVSPKEFVNTPGAKIDYAWYLATQVHPPISRLCEVIEGTDSARIADCLGLDTSKFQITSVYKPPDEESSTSMDDEERYKNCDKLPVACPECNHEGLYTGLCCNEQGTILTAGLKCCDIGGPKTCQGMLAGTLGSTHNRYLCNRASLAIRHYIGKYYNSPYKCDECNFCTKDLAAGMTSFGSPAIESQPCPQCPQATMHRQYSAFDLYTQLCYFRYLFDHERQRATLEKKHQSLPRLSINEMDELDAVRYEMERILDRSAYNFLDLGELFGR